MASFGLGAVIFGISFLILAFLLYRYFAKANNGGFVALALTILASGLVSGHIQVVDILLTKVFVTKSRSNLIENTTS